LIRFGGSTALIQTGDQLGPHACIKGKVTRPVEQQGKSSCKVEHHQFQHVGVQYGREVRWQAAVAIVPVKAKAPRGVKAPGSSASSRTSWGVPMVDWGDGPFAAATG